MPKTILVVDDSRLARLMTKSIFQSYDASFVILEADGGESALKALAAQPVDVASLDYNMPGMEGIDLAKIIKQRYPHVEVMMVTANIQESIAKEAAAIGVHFINKPVTLASVEPILLKSCTKGA